MKNQKQRTADRKAIERAILRTLRECWLGGSEPHVIPATAQVTLLGLERARRQVGK